MTVSLASEVRLPFVDRDDAARQLAQALDRFRGTQPLVLAIPRGAVPMGRIIADALGGELDVALVRKLGAPNYPELAVGAVDEQGTIHVADYAAQAGADPGYIREEAARELAKIRRRRVQYSRDRPPIPVAGRTAIVIDDGLATGATMMAALEAVDAQGPRLLVCAVPVAAVESLKKVETVADEVVCLAAPESFRAVSQYYRKFPQVDDQEVIDLLARRA
jgi:predicted phosphoribosyltransferase